MAAPKFTRFCAACGKEFQPRSPRSKYCDGIHYMKCAICGKDMEATWPMLEGKRTPLCSIECLNKAKGQLAAKSARENAKYDCTCEACGKKF